MSRYWQNSKLTAVMTVWLTVFIFVGKIWLSTLALAIQGTPASMEMAGASIHCLKGQMMATQMAAQMSVEGASSLPEVPETPSPTSSAPTVKCVICVESLVNAQAVLAASPVTLDYPITQTVRFSSHESAQSGTAPVWHRLRDPPVSV